MLLIAIAAANASAADLHLVFTTGEGMKEAWSRDVLEAKTLSFGPVRGRGKRSVIYHVTIPPAVYDASSDVFRVEPLVCREWSKKSKRDRDCLGNPSTAPAQPASSEFGGKVKGSDTFEFTLTLSYSGEPAVLLQPPAP